MERDWHKIGREVDEAVEILLGEFSKDGDGKPRFMDGVFKRELHPNLYLAVLEDRLRRD